MIHFTINFIFTILMFNSMFAQSSDPFVGSFSAPNLKLTLKAENGAYSGEAHSDGQVFQVKAQKTSATAIAGSYSMQGIELPFQAQLQGSKLTLAAGGEIYSLTRQASGQPSRLDTQTGQPDKVKNDEWGMRFTVPAGWTSRLTESGYVIGSNTEKGLILLLPNEAASLEEIRRGAREGITEAGGTQLHLAGETKSFRKDGLAANYEGTLQGKKAKAYAIGLLSPHGIGAIVMVLVEPQSYTPEHTNAVESLARSISFYKPPISPIALDWKQKLNGCRLSYFSRYSSGSSGGYTSETTIDLCSQGFFRYNLNDETVWNAAPGTLTGGYAMKYGKGSGTWRVIAQNGEPILQLDYYNGTVASYTLGTNEKGRTYLDGARYLRTCDPDDQVVEARPNCF